MRTQTGVTRPAALALLDRTSAGRKTQIVPRLGGAPVRDRRSHALEVADVASRIAHAVGLSADRRGHVEAVALLHDLGHPPFGHVGERVLDALSLTRGGYESNAHTIHALLCLEDVPDDVVAHSVKYAAVIPAHDPARTDLRKGIYDQDVAALAARSSRCAADPVVPHVVEIADTWANAAFDLVDIARHHGPTGLRARARALVGATTPAPEPAALLAAAADGAEVDELARVAHATVHAWIRGLVVDGDRITPGPAAVREVAVLHHAIRRLFLDTAENAATDRAIRAALTAAWAVITSSPATRDELSRHQLCDCAPLERPAHTVHGLSEELVLELAGPTGVHRRLLLPTATTQK